MKTPLRPKGCHNRFDQRTILYLTGEENYSHVHLMNGKVILMSRTLKWFEKRWPSFLRVHKHTLINPQHASRVKRGARLTLPSYLIMRDQTQLLISRRRVNHVITQLSLQQGVVYENRTYRSQQETSHGMPIPGLPKPIVYGEMSRVGH